MSNRPSGEQVVAQALQFVGRKYSEMDCQAMVEVAVRACGGEMSYTGSNAMARAVEHLVPLSQAQKEGLRVGAALFIHEEGGSYPQKYHADGLGKGVKENENQLACASEEQSLLGGVYTGAAAGSQSDCWAVRL